MIYKSKRKIIEFQGEEVLVLFKSIKGIYLKLKPNPPHIILSLPKSYPEERIETLLKDRFKWIQENLPSVKKRADFTIQKEGYLWGKQYLVQKEKIDEIRCEGEVLYLPVVEKKLQKAYELQMKEVIDRLLPNILTYLQVLKVEIGFRKMKSRWGTCYPRKKKIYLNRVLVHYPPQCLQYILIHELCHLKEANHQRRFYQWLEGYLPNWKEEEKILRKWQEKIGI